MIQKDKLSKQIDKLIDLEKRTIPLLNKHVSSSLFFSNLKKDERNKIVEYFQNMAITKTKHIDILNSIRDELMKGKKDVY
jgi:hypothetical protein